MIPRNRWTLSLRDLLADRSTVTIEDVAYEAADIIPTSRP
jgi:hypothetical protein